VTRVALAGALLFALGCGPPKTLTEIIPQSARVDDITRIEAVLFGGLGFGGGDVILTEGNGDQWLVPVGLRTATVGAMIDVSAQRGGGDLNIDLGHAQIEDARDVFGTFHGVRYSLVALGGVSGVDMENEAHVELWGFAYSVGIGMLLGHEWLTIEPNGEPEPF
jgi:hypothetical protein